MTYSILIAGVAGLVIPFGAHAADKAHEHGIAKLDIAVDGKKITLQMACPLDNLLGFEHPPRTDAERRQVDTVATQLRAGEALFKVDPAAQCRLASVELTSAVLRLGKSDPSEATDGHADLDGSYEFTCKDATKAEYIDVGLFGFVRVHWLAVQAATPRGQFKRDLKRPATRILLTK